MFPQIKNSWLIALLSVIAGALNGIINYFIFRYAGDLMAVSFLFLVPLVVGLVAALLSPAEKPAKSYLNAALAILLVALGTTLWQYESLFCWIILAPIALTAAFIGVFFVTLFRKRFAAKTRLLFSFMLLPFIASQFEGFIPNATVYQSTHNSIVIQASADVVWHEIKSVPTISVEEYQTSWTHRFGLPRPEAATLSHEGVGAVRVAGFSSGLSFLEEITDWQPNKTLAFSIKAQGDAQSRTAFPLGPDIGGQFVDIESGRYSIEVIDDDTVLLHLRSTQRLSSKLNMYAGFWVNAVMSDLQGTILEVIKQRSENKL